MPKVLSGQTASGIVSSLKTTPEAFLKANPSFAAQAGETQAFQGLTGKIQVGQDYVVPGQEATATPPPTSGSANYAEDLTKSFDKGGGTPNAITGTSDAIRQQALDKIKADMNSGLTKPTAFNSVDTYNKLRTDQGIVQDENELNALHTEQANLKNDLNNFKASSGSGMNESGRLGQVSEKERNANERLDSLSIQEQGVVARMNTKNSYISTMMNLSQQDYATAKATYDQAYNQNLKAIDLYNTQMDSAKKDALTGFTTITNLLKDNNVDPNNISPTLKAQLDSLTLKAGLPAGIFDTLAKSHPDAKILAPIETTNANGSKSIYFFTQDPKTGQPTLLKTYGVGNGGTGGGGTGTTINANGQSITIPSQLTPYTKTSYNGFSYVDLSGVTGKTKDTYAQLAASHGIAVVTAAGDASKLGAIADANENLTKIQDAVNQITLGAKGRNATQGIFNSISGFFGDTNIKSFNAWRTAIINNVQALAGGAGSGLRINKAEIDAAMQNDLPVITGPHADTPESAKAKIATLTSQLNTWEKQLVGGGNTKQNSQTSVTTTMTGPDGKDYNVPNANVDAFIKAGGKRK